MGEEDVFITSSYRKKMEEHEHWAREEEEQTMRREVEEEGHEIEGEGGAGWQWGTSCSASSGVVVGEGDVVCKLPRKEDRGGEMMGKGGRGTDDEMHWHASLRWVKKMEDVKKELDEGDLDLEDDILDAGEKGILCLDMTQHVSPQIQFIDAIACSRYW